jgi:NADPH:quinone reductase-like Zn-dependent oxidoreductase
MTKMKAIRLHRYGRPEVMVYEDAPRPEPAAGEVLIRNIAAGVNPVDYKTRAGRSRVSTNNEFPIIIGWDVSGVVEELGSEVKQFKVGDEVYGMVRFPQLGSAYAEYVAAPASQLALKPPSLDHIHAAAVPLAGLTAWHALFESADLQPGQRILIHAAAGGVGHLAVQLAKWRGAHVTGTASARNAGLLRDLGVDDIIDYTTTPIESIPSKFDVVFDAVGADTMSRSYTLVKPGGIIVSIARNNEKDQHPPDNVRTDSFLVSQNPEHLKQLTAVINAGHVKPLVETVLPLNEAREAHILSERGHTRGKIVLEV